MKKRDREDSSHVPMVPVDGQLSFEKFLSLYQESGGVLLLRPQKSSSQVGMPWFASLFDRLNEQDRSSWTCENARDSTNKTASFLAG
jgi:hypothetical protein